MEALNKYPSQNLKPAESDYQMGGLWYCGKCKTPREQNIEHVGCVPALCKCKLAEKERAEQKAAKEKTERARKTAFGCDRSKRFNFTFANDDRRHADVSDKLKKYCDNFKEHKEKGEGIIIQSPNNGNGKTFLSCAVANELIERGHRVLVTDFLTLRDRLFNPSAFSIPPACNFVTRVDVLNWLCSYDLIVIDDLGTEQSTEFMLEVEYRVIDALTDALVPIILTTNYTLAELLEPNDVDKRRVFDRIKGNCAIISIKDNRSRRIERCSDLTKKIAGSAQHGS